MMELLKELGSIRKYNQSIKIALFKCPICGSEKEYRKSIGLRQRYCSKKCSGIDKTGVKRGNYKKHIISKKYIYIYKPEHPYAIGTRKLYVAEHRLVVEMNLGRYLTKDEVVHHINEDTMDNRLDNLQVMTASEHIMHHIKERKRRSGKFKI